MEWAYGFLSLALGKTLDCVINSCLTDVKQAARANFSHFSFGDTPPLVFHTRFVLHSHTENPLLYSARSQMDVNSSFRCDKIVGPSDSTTLIRWKCFGYWKLSEKCAISWWYPRGKKTTIIMMHHCLFIYRASQILMTCNVSLNKYENLDVVLLIYYYLLYSWLSVTALTSSQILLSQNKLVLTDW